MCVLITMTTLALIFAGRSSGGGTLLFDYDVLRGRVRDAVPDGDRRDRALATLDTMEEDARAHVEAVFDSLEEVRDRMLEYDSDLDALEREYILPLDEERTAFLMRFLDYTFELRDALLVNEWRTVFTEAA